MAAITRNPSPDRALPAITQDPLPGGSSRLGLPLLGSARQSMIDQPFSVLAQPGHAQKPLTLVITPSRPRLNIVVGLWVIDELIFAKDAARVGMIG